MHYALSVKPLYAFPMNTAEPGVIVQYGFCMHAGVSEYLCKKKTEQPDVRPSLHKIAIA